MEAKLVIGQHVDRTAWAELLAHSPQSACFVQPAYLDIIAPGWQAIEVIDEGKLVAVMPLNIKRKGGYTYSLQPPFAQFWGIILREDNQTNPYRAYSWKRKAVMAVLEAMPESIKLFAHTFSPEFDYATPFHWKGYELHTRYTYRLPMEDDADTQWAKLDKSKRSEITHAQKAGVVVEQCENVEHVLPLFLANQAEGKPVLGHASVETFRRLASYLMAGNGGRLLVAKKDDVVVAAGLFVYENNRCIYLTGAQDADQRKLGGMNAFLWEAIRQNAGPGRIFDFEGSMMEPVEAFFRGFGAVPVPYLFIQKNRLPLLVRWIRNSR